MGLGNLLISAWAQQKPLAEIVRLFSSADHAAVDSAAVAALIDLIQRGSVPEQSALCRAAIPRTFTANDFGAFLDKGAPVKLDDLVRRGKVAEVEPGVFCVREADRNGLLEALPPAELRRTSARLLKHYKQSGDAMNAFVCRLYANPAAARSEFLARYRKADAAFEFATLDDLLFVLRGRQDHLEPKLVDALTDREQYYSSRVLHATDWVRSESYLERPALLRAFTTFFDNAKHFVFHVHAPGGSGKTAFLQWLVARHLVAERSGTNRTPVAKLDFDDVDLNALRRWPWLVLVPVAKQLHAQLPNSDLAKLVGSLAAAESVVRRPASLSTEAADREAMYKSVESLAASAGLDAFDAFADGVKSHRCLVVLDTIEELMLHQPATLEAIINGFDQVRRRCRGFRLLISGRYPLAKMEDFASMVDGLAGRMTSLQLQPFSDTESAKYLTNVRKIGDRRLVAKVVRSAKGNPLLLSLYAELAEGGRGLSDEDLRYPEIARLLHRIIERIPESELVLRWTLRYAVVPRERLEPEFFDAVIAPVLERELRGHRQDDPKKSLPSGFENPWKFVENGRVVRKTLWEALRKYAGPLSWVEFDGDIVELRPEVMLPMRWLLRTMPVFPELHQRAVAFFEERARGQPPVEWARSMANAIYHRFQLEGPTAEVMWRAALAAPDAVDTPARRILAELMLSRDFVDEGKPLSDPRTHKLLVGEATLAQSHLELASIAAREARNAPLATTRDIELGEADRQLRSLKRVERRMKVRLADSPRREFVEASVASFRGQSKKAVRVASAALAQNESSVYAPSFLMMLADLEPNIVRASALYERAQRFVEGREDALISLATIRQRHAARWSDAGNLERAEEILGEGVVALAHDHPDATALMTSRIHVAQLSGSTQRVESLLEESGGWPLTRTVRLSANAFVQVVRGAARYWLSENSRAYTSIDDDEQMEYTIWRARALGQLFRADEAHEELNNYITYFGDRRADLAERLTLEKAQIALDVVGARAVAASILPEKLVSPTNRLRYLLLKMRAAGSHSRVTEIWKRDLGRLLPTLSVRDKASALIHRIVATNAPTNAAWSDFLRVARQIEPAEARFSLLRPLPYSIAPIRRRTTETIEPDFPNPRPGPDFLDHNLLLASLYTALRQPERAVEVLHQARGALPIDNLVLLNRFVRVARRCRCEPDQPLLNAVRHEIESNATVEAPLAATAAVELSWWMHRMERGKDAASALRIGRDIAKRASFRFDGRSKSLVLQLSKEYTTSRSVPRARLPLEKSAIVKIVRNPNGFEAEAISASGTRTRSQPFADELLNDAIHPWSEISSVLRRVAFGELLGGRPVTVNLELRVDADAPSWIPWEVAFAKLTSRICYRNEGPRPKVTAAWFQRALLDFDDSVRVTGQWTAGNQTLLRDVARRRRIPVGSLENEDGKVFLRRLLKAPPMVALLRRGFAEERSQHQGYGAAGIDLAKLLKNGAVLVQGDLQQVVAGTRQVFYWVNGYFDATSAGVTLYAGKQRMTADQFARSIAQWEDSVVVLLDVLEESNPWEQAKLRNQFADAVYAYGGARSVIGGGLVRRAKLTAYANAIVAAVTATKSESELLRDMQEHCEIPPILFSADPGLPIG